MLGAKLLEKKVGWRRKRYMEFMFYLRRKRKKNESKRRRWSQREGKKKWEDRVQRGKRCPTFFSFFFSFQFCVQGILFFFPSWPVIITAEAKRRSKLGWWIPFFTGMSFPFSHFFLYSFSHFFLFSLTSSLKRKECHLIQYFLCVLFQTYSWKSS